MTIQPSSFSTEKDAAVKSKEPSERPSDSRRGAFEELVAKSSLPENVVPSRTGSGPSFGDLSRLRHASFDPMGFAHGGGSGGGLSLYGITMGQMTSSFLSKLFGGQELPAHYFMGGFQRSVEESLLSHAALLEEGASEPVETSASRKELGALSARFESGAAGVASVGYDRHGGTSYGTYQISSRQGTMSRFLDFLDTHDPRIGTRLRQAGADNTGSTRGAFPDEWRKIAAENPEHFEGLQRQFITKTHYEPALAEIQAETGMDLSQCSPTMHQVLWSTAVQHGPRGAAGIFQEALKGSDTEQAGRSGELPVNERKVIDRVYALRSTKFGSSSNEVRAAVLSRFRHEKQLALNMLHENQRIG